MKLIPLPNYVTSTALLYGWEGLGHVATAVVTYIYSFVSLDNLKVFFKLCGMKNGKLTVIIFGSIGCIIAILLCWLGVSTFLEQTETYTTYIRFWGAVMTGKTYAAVLIWIGLVLIFYCIRKMIKYLKAV